MVCPKQAGRAKKLNGVHRFAQRLLSRLRLNVTLSAEKGLLNTQKEDSSLTYPAVGAGRSEQLSESSKSLSNLGE
jgi:hypothetical protein